MIEEDYEWIKRFVSNALVGYEEKLRDNHHLVREGLESTIETELLHTLETLLLRYPDVPREMWGESTLLIVEASVRFGDYYWPMASEPVEEMFYFEAQGELILTEEAEALVANRWPLTHTLAEIFRIYKKKSESSTFEEYAVAMADLILDQSFSPHIRQTEADELLRYYKEGNYKACYFFASSYCERLQATYLDLERVQRFKGNFKERHDTLKDEWGTLLDGLAKSVYSHWEGVEFQNIPERPTRHSLAHGIHAAREVNSVDAIQMLLILQDLPYWLELAKEIQTTGTILGHS